MLFFRLTTAHWGWLHSTVKEDAGRAFTQSHFQLVITIKDVLWQYYIKDTLAPNIKI